MNEHRHSAHGPEAAAEARAQRVHRSAPRPAQAESTKSKISEATASEAARPSVFHANSGGSTASWEQHATANGKIAANEITNGLKREIIASSLHAAMQQGTDHRISVGVDVREPRTAANTVVKSLDEAFAGKDARNIAQGVIGKGADGQRLDPPIEARLDRSKLLNWYADQMTNHGATLHVTPPSNARAAMLSASLTQASATESVSMQSRHPAAGMINKTLDAHDAYAQARQEMAGMNGYQAVKPAEDREKPHQVLARSQTLSQLAGFGQELARDRDLVVDPRLQQLSAAKEGATGHKTLGVWADIFYPKSEPVLEIASTSASRPGLPAPKASSTEIIIAPATGVARTTESSAALTESDRMMFAAIAARNGEAIDARRQPPRERVKTIDVEAEVLRAPTSAESRVLASEAPSVRSLPFAPRKVEIEHEPTRPGFRHEFTPEFQEAASRTAHQVAGNARAASVASLIASYDRNPEREVHAKVISVATSRDVGDLASNMRLHGPTRAISDANAAMELRRYTADARTAQGANIPWAELV